MPSENLNHTHHGYRLLSVGDPVIPHLLAQQRQSYEFALRLPALFVPVHLRLESVSFGLGYKCTLVAWQAKNAPALVMRRCQVTPALTPRLWQPRWRLARSKVSHCESNLLMKSALSLTPKYISVQCY